MSGFLFLLVIDWVMKRAVDYYVGTGIRWNMTTTLEDADFADYDLVPILSTFTQIQKKIDRLNRKRERKRD